MMNSLPKELTREQQRAAKELLTEHEAIFSKGEYDIGRTPYVEYHFDTGAHRPIRQALRRHPFKYLDVIDKLVEEMKAHGIIEPAASPWASNVVLVRSDFALTTESSAESPCRTVILYRSSTIV